MMDTRSNESSVLAHDNGQTQESSRLVRVLRSMEPTLYRIEIEKIETWPPTCHITNIISYPTFTPVDIKAQVYDETCNLRMITLQVTKSRRVLTCNQYQQSISAVNISRAEPTSQIIWLS